MVATTRLATLAVLLIAGFAGGCGRSKPSATEAQLGDVPTEPQLGDPVGSCGAGLTVGPAMARTKSGVVQGVATGTSVTFMGIPYAAPPVGPLRFRSTEPHACWSDVRQAIGFGNECLQLDATGKGTGDEDCLTLNVWTPSLGAEEALPVFFFIHGGANIVGSTKALWLGETAYDGKELAERAHAVVVTANYRLGALGFLTLPELAAESATQSSGNYGLRDLLAALRWVQANGRAFGGDPSRVFLFGQSAGALNTCALVASPLAQGLFSRAMMMSERCDAPPASAVEHENARVAQATGCADAADLPACLRGLSANKLTEAVPGSWGVTGAVGEDSFYYSLNVDGDVLEESPLEAIAHGRHNAVPFIVGTTAHETSSQIAALSPKIETEDDYRAVARKLYGAALGDLALAQYPAGTNPFQALVLMTTDQRFTCPARRIARAFAQGQTAAVRRYAFTYYTEHPRLRAYGAFHGIDLAFAFRTLHPFGDAPTATDEAVSDRYIRYLARFAQTGDPNDAADAEWPAFSTASGGILQIGAKAHATADYAAVSCDFWDAHQ